MRSLLHIEPGLFYALGQGHMIADQPLPPGSFELGTKLELNSMFDMWLLNRLGKPVGFYFVSAFKTICKGGFILTFMESKRGKAKTHRLVIRQPEVMVYDFPGCGALAVATHVGDKVLSILTEQ